LQVPRSQLEEVKLEARLRIDSVPELADVPMELTHFQVVMRMTGWATVANERDYQGVGQNISRPATRVVSVSGL